MSLYSAFQQDVAAAELATDGRPGREIDESEVATLPAAARRYLRFMGVVGRPRDATLRLHLHGRFRPRPGSRWLDAEVWQFNSRPDRARLFDMQLRMLGVPVLGRDHYLRGAGSMVIRPLDLFTLQDERGPELDVGELVTYLNDCVLLAPTMLLDPAVAFSAVDDGAFDLTLTDRATTVRARVFVDGRGAPTDFSTTDRFHGRVRTRWTTPVEGWQPSGWRQLPTAGRATWHLPSGELTYAEFSFRPEDLAWNVAPG